MSTRRKGAVQSGEKEKKKKKRRRKTKKVSAGTQKKKPLGWSFMSSTPDGEEEFKDPRKEYEEMYQAKVKKLEAMSGAISSVKRYFREHRDSTKTEKAAEQRRQFDAGCRSYVVQINELAMFCLRHEDIERCRSLLTTAARLSNPEWGPDCVNLRILTLNNLSALARHGARDLEEAMRYLKQAFRLGKTYKVPQTASEYSCFTHLNLGAILCVLGRHEPSYKEAQIALRLANQILSEQVTHCPQMIKNARIAQLIGYHNAAVELTHLKRKQEAKAYFDKAKSLKEKALSWELEFALCPAPIDRRPLNNPPTAKTLSMLAKGGKWTLESAKQRSKNSLFRSWRVLSSTLPETATKATKVKEDPTKSKRSKPKALKSRTNPRRRVDSKPCASHALQLDRTAPDWTQVKPSSFTTTTAVLQPRSPNHARVPLFDPELADQSPTSPALLTQPCLGPILCFEQRLATSIDAGCHDSKTVFLDPSPQSHPELSETEIDTQSRPELSTTKTTNDARSCRLLSPSSATSGDMSPLST